MKKAFSLVLLSVFFLTACSSSNTASVESKSQSLASSSASAQETQEQKIALSYTKAMQEQGFTQVFEFEKIPERVVCLTPLPVIPLYEMGVTMVGVTETKLVEWPEELDALQKFNLASAGNFNVEDVVALEPDLVFIAASNKEPAGETLENAGIPVYYITAGKQVTYDSVKEQTAELVKAFDNADKAGEKIMERFTQLEARLEKEREKYEGKSVLVIQSAGGKHNIQTEDGTLGTMAKMVGFENVYSNPDAAMVPMDLEQAITYNPDIILLVGDAQTAEEHEAFMQEEFAKNPNYWNSIDAVKNGHTIYLDYTYRATAGVNIVDNISALLDTLEQHSWQ